MKDKYEIRRESAVLIEENINDKYDALFIFEAFLDELPYSSINEEVIKSVAERFADYRKIRNRGNL